jgi:hypothetical protein
LRLLRDASQGGRDPRPRVTARHDNRNLHRVLSSPPKRLDRIEGRATPTHEPKNEHDYISE